MSEYISIVIGETGDGKSSFINAITNQYNCKVPDNDNKEQFKFKACTTEYQLSNAEREGITFTFVDTPGVNDNKGDLENEEKIISALNEYPKIRAILILLKFNETKLKASTIQSLKKFMNLVPLPDFWKNIIIIRSYADKSSKYFEDDKKKIEGTITKCLSCDEFKDFKKFMLNLGIHLPTIIKEYYVDCRNEEKYRKDTQISNKDEFDQIYKAIKNLPLMINSIEIQESSIINKQSTFDKLETWKTIKFYDINNNLIKEFKYPRPFRIKELSDLPVKRSNSWDEPQYSQSSCRKKRTYYYHYRQNFYVDNGKEIAGDICKVDEYWSPWK